MSQQTGSHKNSLNFLGEKHLNESHWPMRRIGLLEYIERKTTGNTLRLRVKPDAPLVTSLERILLRMLK